MKRTGTLFLGIGSGMLIFTALTAGAVHTNGASAAAASQAAGWTLAWSEEFDQGRLDTGRWSLCERGPSDWCKWMSKEPRLLTLTNGVLRLWGVVDGATNVGSNYLTAGVTSQGKFAFHYGKAEIRARFKSARGAWPALWMLGASRGWPACGEIDLMEHLNFDAQVYQTVHSEYTWTLDKSRTPPPGGTAKIDRDAWNVYGCEWDREQIVFTVNGKPTHRYPRVPEKGDKQWPFDQPFYLLLSMQIGGGWVNSSGPTDPSQYPAWLEVDWVRVYQAKAPAPSAEVLEIANAANHNPYDEP